jgi:hypothetical protein
MRFEFEIDDALLSGLAEPIGRTLAEDPAARAAFAAFATEQVLGWMSGAISHTSLTDEQVAWLQALLPLFYGDQPPTAERIFNGFSVPYGRAAYIARVLREKQLPVWRNRDRAGLLAALRLKQEEAERNMDGGFADKPVPVSIDAGGYRELTVLVVEILDAAPALNAPINKGGGVGRRTINVPSELFAPLFERLEPHP